MFLDVVMDTRIAEHIATGLLGSGCVMWCLTECTMGGAHCFSNSLGVWLQWASIKIQWTMAQICYICLHRNLVFILLTGGFEGGGAAGSIPSPTHLWSLEYHHSRNLRLNATAGNMLPSNSENKLQEQNNRCTSTTNSTNHLEEFDVISSLFIRLSLVPKQRKIVYYHKFCWISTSGFMNTVCIVQPIHKQHFGPSNFFIYYSILQYYPYTTVMTDNTSIFSL